MPSSTFLDALTAEEAAELKAHHLACSQLVNGCQDAIFRLRGEAAGNPASEEASDRAIEIMERTLASWCETLSILRASLHRDSSRGETYGINGGMDGSVADDRTPKMSRFVKAVFAGTSPEHASRS